jgi:hypothetical protein
MRSSSTSSWSSKRLVRNIFYRMFVERDQLGDLDGDERKNDLK